jgi:hypothetical protein
MNKQSIKSLTVGQSFAFVADADPSTLTYVEGITVGAPGEGTRVSMRSAGGLRTYCTYPSLTDVYVA